MPRTWSTPGTHEHTVGGLGIEKERTTNHAITTSTYTVGQTYGATNFDLSGGVITYDGTNELVLNAPGGGGAGLSYLCWAWAQARFAHNATGIRLVSFAINDTTAAAPLGRNQARMPVTADANEDFVWIVRPLLLVDQDRVCIKVWQNSGGNVNVQYLFGMELAGPLTV